MSSGPLATTVLAVPHLPLPPLLLLLLPCSLLELADAAANTPNNTCVQAVGVKYNNTDYADGNGPRTAANASDCCNQCIAQRNCQYWSFQIDAKNYPGVTQCRWAHLTYCCYFHSGNTSGIPDQGGWTSGGFTGIKPGPPPPPPPCDTFKSKDGCPAKRCMWDPSKGCTRPPPPPPPPGPCAKATQKQCGVGTPPYTGERVFCAAACKWNGTTCDDRKPAGYTMPANDSLVALVSAATPLPKDKPTVVSFYGDSITFLNLYEGVISKALKSGEGTKDLNITLIDQGVNGGTVTDLVVGFSPWGHLDPHKPQSNISFAETIARDKPDIIAIQIGENDVMQQPSRGENVSHYTDVLREKVVKVAKASGAKVYLATISVIGEEVNNTNHAKIITYADAMKSVAKEEGVPCIDLITRYIAYEQENNCLNIHGGVLTGAGVHPYTPQGQMMLANAHSEGIIAALKQSN